MAWNIDGRQRGARRWLAALALAGAALAGSAAGCGGLGPGDYVIYRVALGEPKPGKSCALDDNLKNDTSTFRSTQTFILYAGQESTFYLDTGPVTLEGTASGDTYSFAGASVDVEFAGPTGQDKVTTALRTNIEMTVDGALVTGTVSSVASVKHACVDPDQCPEDTACTRTSDFVGTELEDVELRHDPG